MPDTDLLFRVRPDERYLQQTLAVLPGVCTVFPAAGWPVPAEQVLAWEAVARRLYHGALRYRICRDMGFAHPGLEDFAARALAALAERPDWRPEAAGGFDRNNWANGYLPGAWGLLGGDADTFHARGTSFVEKLPGADHWVRRSTNHGIVILASYLTGARALRQPPVGLGVLRRTVLRSLGNGCYPEGVNYLGFVLSELAPYLTAAWDGRTEWHDHVAEALPGVAEAKRMYAWMAGLDGRIRATFADVSELKVYRNTLAFADSLSPRGDLSRTLSDQPLRCDGRLEPLVRDLPRGGDPVPPEATVFDCGISTARTAGWALWVFGSTLHLTHNAAHDCGSFVFQRPDLLVSEQPGREAFRHNVPLLSDAPGFPDCPGPVPFAKRRLHGEVTRIDATSWQVIAPRAFIGCPSEIRMHFRHLHVIRGCLVVLDRVFVDGPGEPVQQFHTDRLTALWGHRMHKDNRALCRMKKARRGWLGAAVIGARPGTKLSTAGGALVFDGQTIPFPPETGLRAAAG